MNATETPGLLALDSGPLAACRWHDVEPGLLCGHVRIADTDFHVDAVEVDATGAPRTSAGRYQLGHLRRYDGTGPDTRYRPVEIGGRLYALVFYPFLM